MFLSARDPEPGWRDELYAIGGRPNRMAAYLDLFWLAGEPPAPGTADQVVQRWVVWELIPREALERTPHHQRQAQEIITALTGPPPVTMRSWKVVNGHRQIRSTSLISQDQWSIYRRTGCYAKPFWVIQGDTGGHLVSFPPAYQALLRVAGRPLHPPAPGTLPYAPWDARVRAQLIRERELRERLEAYGTRDQTQKTDRDHKRQDLEIEREGRRQLLRWLEQQLGYAADVLSPAFAQMNLPVRPDQTVKDEDMAQVTESFVQDTTPTDASTL